MPAGFFGKPEHFFFFPLRTPLGAGAFPWGSRLSVRAYPDVVCRAPSSSSGTAALLQRKALMICGLRSFAFANSACFGTDSCSGVPPHVRVVPGAPYREAGNFEGENIGVDKFASPPSCQLFPTILRMRCAKMCAQEMTADGTHLYPVCFLDSMASVIEESRPFTKKGPRGSRASKLERMIAAMSDNTQEVFVLHFSFASPIHCRHQRRQKGRGHGVPLTSYHLTTTGLPIR